ncbi:hypothetical protein C1H46_015528 [Malus baccata]|uniref:Agglutinin domain-containing protein n=1 Tax=Malus baccata TaxID=106549 RepID=A0A540MJC2_MALBA|nr:hypothetical protein C1H46_015528 [Malus baccata]
MAAALPDRFAWKSNSKSNSRYLRCLKDGILAFTDDTPNTIFLKEDPKISEFVNIRLSAGTGLYLEGVDSKKNEEPTILITATAAKANNNQPDVKCTLFEPKLIDAEHLVFRFIHVHSKLFLMPDKDERLYANGKEPDANGNDLFTVESK